MIGRHDRQLSDKVALVFFATGLFISVAAVDFHIAALPVRAVFITVSFGLCIWGSPEAFRQSIQSNIKLLAIIMISAGIGFAISLLNGNSFFEVLRQITEIHVQAAICLLLAAMLVARFGVTLIAYIFIGVWACTAFVALAQFAGFESAWQLRSALGDLMNDPAITRQFYDRQERALGLSFTPIHLASQTVLAFAVYFILRIYATSGAVLKRLDGPLLLGLFMAILICILSGNRSPLLGLIIFFVVYITFVAPRVALVAAPLLISSLIAGPSLLDIALEYGLRIAITDDGSATGRATLARYGLLLIQDNLMGYGLLFNSTDHAGAYVHILAHLDNAGTIKYFTLHNYYLQMLAKYGVLILAVVPLVVPTRKEALWPWLAFVPYMVHIFFHNDGPLSSDFLIWFLLPLVVPAMKSSIIAKEPENRKWTRAFHTASST